MVVGAVDEEENCLDHERICSELYARHFSFLNNKSAINSNRSLENSKLESEINRPEDRNRFLYNSCLLFLRSDKENSNHNKDHSKDLLVGYFLSKKEVEDAGRHEHGTCSKRNADAH